MDVKKVLSHKYWPIMSQKAKRKHLLTAKVGDFPTTPENIAAMRSIVKQCDSVEEAFPKIDEFLAAHDLSWEMLEDDPSCFE